MGILDLTELDKNILELLAQGLAIKEVANKLNLGTRKVKHHIYNDSGMVAGGGVLEKLGARGITQAVAIYLREKYGNDKTSTAA